MKVLEINAYPYGSTGKIMVGIAAAANKDGIECITSSGYSSHPIRELPQDHKFIGGFFSKGCHKVLSALAGLEGIWSPFATNTLLKIIKPDIVHLHNLHGWYINLPMLFRYIKKNGIPVVWTLHDCWAFTGRCPHFTLARCDKWKAGCLRCPYPKHSYPATYIDRTKTMWKLKKKWFTGVKDMTIVTPSQWLADLVKQSFLRDYPVRVIHNGIDLAVFKPTDSGFRAKHGIGGRYILLGVAFGWGRRKGLDVFVELSKRLGAEYQIVLVGTDDRTDKLLPDNIISIHRTNNQRELAEIYTAADLFVNPTREENYPTVNMEALACGTPVVTFDTGGSPETIDATCGASVPCDDIDALEAKIRQIASERPYPPPACIKRAESFDEKNRYEEYIELYKGERL